MLVHDSSVLPALNEMYYVSRVLSAVKIVAT